jgi:Zn-dependent M28 family amino/carboxypeptidase
LCETNISYFNIQYDTTTWQYNVIGTLNGITNANRCMVLGAHYDDIVAPEGDPMLFAPGADDNASGVSALFECLRILSQNGYYPVYDIEFVAFAAEELMYYGNSGAQAYVDSTLAKGRNIELMINNDMIAYTADDNWRISISNHAGNQWLTAISKGITEDYTSIIPKVRQLTYEAGADCKYFYEAGVPCVYFMEYNFNPFYHTINDLVENADMNYCAEAIKVSLGTILSVMDTTTTGIEELPAFIAKAYPNPTTGVFKLKLEKPIPGQQLTYSIVDLKGRSLASGNLKFDDEVVVNLNGFPEGIYIVNFQSSTKLVSKKLILTRN